MRRRKLKTQIAAALTASLLISSVAPLASLAETFSEIPIGSDSAELYELATMSNAKVSVEFEQKEYEISYAQLEAEPYSMNFFVNVDIDNSDVVATASGGNRISFDEEETQIASELKFGIDESTLQEAEALGIALEVSNNPFSVVVTGTQFADTTADRSLTIELTVDQENVTYPGELSIQDTGVTKLLITGEEPQEEKSVAAKGVNWWKTGWAQWDDDALSESEKENVKYTKIKVFRDGEYLGPLNSQGYSPYIDLRHFFTEEGIYTFQATFLFEEDPGTLNWSEMSDPFDYKFPDKKLDPVNAESMKWTSDGTITWDPVTTENGDQLEDKIRYVTYLYQKNEETGEYEQNTEGMGRTSEPEMDYSFALEVGGTYKVKIMAEGDLINYANSDWSDFSIAFQPGQAVEDNKDILNDLLNSEDVKTAVDNTILTDGDKKALKLAVQLDSETANRYDELESKYNEALGAEKIDFKVDASSTNKVDESQVEVVGGILNGATGIKFDDTTAADLIHAGANEYRRKSAVNISLLPETQEGELGYPVLIIMPVPRGIRAEDVVIIHVHNDGRKEDIYPRAIDKKTVAFAVTEFSTFVFADETSKGNSGSSGSGSSGGSGGGSGSSSSRGTVQSGFAPNGTWLQDATGWWFKKMDGTYPKDEWYECVWNGQMKWYHFNPQGYLNVGWYVDKDGLTYYLHEQHDGNFGYMYTGWNWIGGKCYYFNTETKSETEKKGSLVCGTVTPDGYTVGADGAWTVDGVVQTK